MGNSGHGLEYAAVNGPSPVIHNNTFCNNRGLELVNRHAATLDVTGNWWGTNAPVYGVRFSGLLDYDPWVMLSLSAQPRLVPADGASQATITASMIDGAGHHAPNDTGVALAASLGTLSSVAVKTANGTAAAQLTAPALPGTAWLTATASCGQRAATWVSFVVPQPQTLTLTAAPPAVPANGSSASILTAQVVGSGGGPVPDGTVVVFTTTLGTFPGGVQTTPRPAGTATAEAEGSGVTRIGTWSPYTEPPPDGPVVVYSNVPGDRVRYAFTGTGAGVVFQKQFNAGVARVLLDGVLYREIDTYWNDGSGTGKLYRQLEMIATGLPYGPHVVEVVVAGIPHPGAAGAHVVLDAFRAYGTARNGAYLTVGGSAAAALTATAPGTAAVTACAGAACDTAPVIFRPSRRVYLPVIVKRLDPPPTPTPTQTSTPTPSRTPTPTPTPTRTPTPTPTWTPTPTPTRTPTPTPTWTPTPTPTPTHTPTPVPPDCYPAWLADAPAGDVPHGVAVNSAAGRLYVANYQADTLSAINTTTYALVHTASVGDGPNAVAYNPANGYLYVANRNAGTVTVLRAADYGLVKTLTVGSQPNGIAANAALKRVYVANWGSDTVSIIDTTGDTILKTVAVGNEPAMIAVNPETNRAYVSLHGDGQVAVVDSANNVSWIDNCGSAGAYGIAVDSVRNLVYVATIDTFRIVALDGAAGTCLGWAESRREGTAEPVPLRMIAVNPAIGSSGHVFVTTAGEDGGWNSLLALAKGWPEYFSRAYALPLDEAREGLAFEPATRRVYAASRTRDLVAAYQDGEPVCPQNFALQAYRVTVCVAGPGGRCVKTLEW